MSHAKLLAWGMAVLIVSDIVLARADHGLMVIAGVVLWGVHMGMTQGLLATMVADTAHPSLRGTAFGVFNLVSGIAMLAASATAGWLWQTVGASATFVAGAMFASLTLIGVVIWSKSSSRTR